MSEVPTGPEAPPGASPTPLAPAAAPRAVEACGLLPSSASGRYQPAVHRPGRLVESVLGRMFRHIHVDPNWADAVRCASRRGHVVYIGRAQSFLDFLGLDYLVKRHGLPPIEFTSDLGLGIFEPFGRGAQRLRMASPPREDHALGETLRSGASALLFLRRPPGAIRLAGRVGRGSEPPGVDLVRALVALQRKLERPIILMPQTLVWTKRTPNRRPTLIDVLFGPSDWPGRLRTALQFLFNYRNAVHRGGEPFDLLDYLTQHDELTDAEAADAIRFALLRRMERERTIVLGPARKTSARIKDELLRSPRLRKHMEQAARERGVPMEQIEVETRRELDRLAAAPDPNVVGLMDRVLRWVWRRIYDGLVVDEAGLARVRDAARRGPLVLVPSHKSHVDYLVVSSVFYGHGLAPPLIAAGDNLSFFPLGPLFRRAGAFFIRRSFKGQKLYPHIVDAYVRKILTEGHSLEVFIEGGRSRTGKLLPPKLGILSMIVDAGLLARSRPIQFVPISIGYERIIEESAYVRELEGGEKRREDLGGLLRAPRVLRSRYGRLYLQFGEIFDLATLADEALRASVGPPGGQAHDAPNTLSPARRRALISRIAHRITHEINRVTPVTPAALLATVLLAHPGRAMTRSEILASADDLLAAFQRVGAPIAKTIAEAGSGMRAEAIEQALALLLDAKLLVASAGSRSAEVSYHVPDARRISLEYLKNNVIHFFVPSALVACAIAPYDAEVAMATLRERVRSLSRLFKLEFQYRADAPFEEIFSDALGHMIEAGELLWEGDVVRLAPGPDGERLRTYASMLRTYVESYLFMLDLVTSPKALPASLKDFTKAALSRARRAHAAGEITLRESTARSKIETALAAFHELGIVRLEAERVTAGVGPGIEDAITTYRGLLRDALGPTLG